MHDQVTVVVGIDAKTIEQWEVSLPTWIHYHPELRGKCRWIVFHDCATPSVENRAYALMDKNLLPAGQTKLIKWPCDVSGKCDVPTYGSQRERMLTGFVHVPAKFGTTPFWCKIDTDAICLERKPLWEPEWFEWDQEKHLPLAFVASPWSYSKPAEQPGQLDAWGDTVTSAPAFESGQKLNLPSPEPGARRIGHKRMASWWSLYSAEFTHYASVLAERHCGVAKIPVPSQDGYHFYVAHRGGWPYKLASFKRRGWTNCSKLSSLKETAARVLNTNQAASIVDA